MLGHPISLSREPDRVIYPLKTKTKKRQAKQIHSDTCRRRVSDSHFRRKIFLSTSTCSVSIWGVGGGVYVICVRAEMGGCWVGVWDGGVVMGYLGKFWGWKGEGKGGNIWGTGEELKLKGSIRGEWKLRSWACKSTLRACVKKSLSGKRARRGYVGSSRCARYLNPIPDRGSCASCKLNVDSSDIIFSHSALEGWAVESCFCFWSASAKIKDSIIWTCPVRVWL